MKNSSTRTLEISIPIESIKQYFEPVLHTTGVLAPREELIKLEILGQAPWNTDGEVPLRLTVQKIKEVERTEVGKGKASL